MKTQRKGKSLPSSSQGEKLETTLSMLDVGLLASEPRDVFLLLKPLSLCFFSYTGPMSTFRTIDHAAKDHSDSPL